ncbi:MAG: reprolysin-like metallopeptidase, partial [Chthoniobacterales bacterium]
IFRKYSSDGIPYLVLIGENGKDMTGKPGNEWQAPDDVLAEIEKIVGGSYARSLRQPEILKKVAVIVLAITTAAVTLGFLLPGETGVRKNRDTASRSEITNEPLVSGSSSAGKNPASFDPTAAEYQLDGPRKRNELGQALPFRERSFPASSIDLLQRANRGNFATLELFPGVSFRVRVTGRWDDQDGIRVAASLEGHPEKDRLFASWNKDSMRTLIELPSENLAYELINDGKGGYLVREWLFTDVVCATPSPETRGADAGIPRPAGAQASNGAPIAAAAIPVLNSRPGAVAVIYLDFDGEVVSGTAWSGGATINAPAARLNASQITEVHERVSRDFELFNVNVTTDRAIHDAAPLNRRTHCVITSNDQAAPGAGGVAYLNSFAENFTSRKICWAFLDTNAKDTAEVISHEVGHTLGLDHDGRNASGSLPRDEYYSGQGSGATGWAPIMGVGYY